MDRPPSPRSPTKTFRKINTSKI